MPHRNPTVPAVAVATGRTSFGNAMPLMRFPWRITEVVASLMAAMNHFHGSNAAKMKSG
jgi:hypothetical protein